MLIDIEIWEWKCYAVLLECVQNMQENVNLTVINPIKKVWVQRYWNLYKTVQRVNGLISFIQVKNFMYYFTGKQMLWH